jgi:hypothetical protein
MYVVILSTGAKSGQGMKLCFDERQTAQNHLGLI